MRDDDIASLGHANLIEFSRRSASWGEGGRVGGHDGVLLFATGSWVPVNCNGAFRQEPDVAPQEVLDQADEFFGGLGRGYTVKIRDTGEDDDLRAACQQAGLTPFGDGSPEMVLASRLADASPPGDIDIKVVSTADQVGDFARVNGEAYGTYGIPPGQVPVIFSRPAALLGTPDVISVVAYRDGQALAAAQVLLSHGIAGVYWVGAVEAARGQGLGEAVTRVVGNIAFDRGAKASTLQASPMGEPIYRRMGYVNIYRYTDYVRMSPRE